jgi:outer membrane murein-binding lipoprotein Lpp
MKEVTSIMKYIAIYRDFLLEHMEAYLDAGRYLHGGPGGAGVAAAASSSVAPMTDDQRDEIDKEAVEFARACCERIERLDRFEDPALAVSARERARGGTALAHRKGARAILFDRLRSVTKVVEAMRSERYRQARLAQRTTNISQDEADRAQTAAPVAADVFRGWEENQRAGSRADARADGTRGAAEDGAASDDLARRRLENQLLQHRLESELDDVRTMHAKMLEISSLINTFSTKVLEQHEDVEHLYDEAQRATDDVSRAKDLLRSAAEHGNAARRIICGIFVSAGLSLLFLDWMNP